MTPARKVAMEMEKPRPHIRSLVTGSAVFGMDVRLPGMVHAKFIRFPYGAGRVRSANVGAARAVEGVLEVELDEDAECRYCGERIGHVVAESRAALGDALAALNLRFSIASHQSDPSGAWNGPGELSGEERATLDGIWEGAAAVVEAVYTTQVQTHSPMETHGAVVHHKGDSLEAWSGTQGVTGYGGQLERISGLNGSQITVHSEYCGGAFGSKFGPGAEGTLATQLSRKHGRPVHLYVDRREEHLDTGNRPGSIQYMKLAVDDEGRILGGHLDLTSIVGHGGRGGGVRNPSYYDFGNVVRKEHAISLNAGNPRAFRAPGFPQGAFAVESMMDELAGAAGMDPVAFRKVNELSDRRREQYDRGAALIGWENRRPDGSTPGIVKTGYGVGAASWGNPHGACEVEIDIFRDGHLEVRCGIQDIGTGTAAVAVDVVADFLGMDRRNIVGKIGRSTYPPGPASGGSVVSRVAGTALRDAAARARDRIASVVAGAWDVDAATLAHENGVYTDGDRSLTWRDACALLPEERATVRGSFNEEHFGSGNSDGVQFARVNVDTETGIVQVEKVVVIQCCGRVVNRLTAENQLHGGVIQGISYALHEDRILDVPTGAMVNPDFLYYKISGSRDVPEIVAVFDVRDDEDGIRALGEPVTVPTSGVIANAVANAIGVRVRSLPMTPARVLEALHEKGGTG